MITLALILSVLLLACIGGVLWYEGAGEEMASWLKEDDREHPRPTAMWPTTSAPNAPLPDWYVHMQQGGAVWPQRHLAATPPLTSRRHLRGFASMDPVKQREIASRGGRKAHETGRAHQWTSEEAQAAGRKGGVNSHKGRA